MMHSRALTWTFLLGHRLLSYRLQVTSSKPQLEMISKRLLRFSLGPSFLEDNGSNTKLEENNMNAQLLGLADYTIISHLNIVKQRPVTTLKSKQEKSFADSDKDMPIQDDISNQQTSNWFGKMSSISVNQLYRSGFFAATAIVDWCCSVTTIRCGVFYFDNYLQAFKSAFFTRSSLLSFGICAFYDTVGQLLAIAAGKWFAKNEQEYSIIEQGACDISVWCFSGLLKWSTEYILDVSGEPFPTTFRIYGIPIPIPVVLAGLRYLEYLITMILGLSVQNYHQRANIPSSAGRGFWIIASTLTNSAATMLTTVISRGFYIKMAAKYPIHMPIGPNPILYLQAMGIQWTICLGIAQLQYWALPKLLSPVHPTNLSNMEYRFEDEAE